MTSRRRMAGASSLPARTAASVITQAANLARHGAEVVLAAPDEQRGAGESLACEGKFRARECSLNGSISPASIQCALLPTDSFPYACRSTFLSTTLASWRLPGASKRPTVLNLLSVRHQHARHFALTRAAAPRDGGSRGSFLGTTTGGNDCLYRTQERSAELLMTSSRRVVMGRCPLISGSRNWANLMFAFELDRRLRASQSRVMSVAAHPGGANTRHASRDGHPVVSQAARSVLGSVIGDAVQ